MSIKTMNEMIRKHVKAISLSILGILSAAIIPIWQIYFVEQPDVHIEITEIRRINSSDFKVPLSTDELQLLKPYLDEDLFYTFDKNGNRADKINYPEFSIETINAAFNKAKMDIKNITETKSILSKHIATINKYLNPKDKAHLLIEFRVGEIKDWSLRNYIDDDEARYYEKQVLRITRDYADMHFQKGKGAPINTDALNFLLSDVKEDLIEVISENEIRVEKLRDNIQAIDTQITKLKKEQRDIYSFFDVSVVATNNGRASASLRPVALLRVNISKDNYVNLKLDMDDYQDQSNLPEGSTKILHYQSKILHDIPSEDRIMVNTFWGSTGRASVLSLDTKQNIYISNTIAFADNSNQKVMFDKLKESANSL
ncbi:hypothetical protein C0J08_20075 [Marinomonas sp. CT5]|uniref:hypothetical protein n=1 Tax=Marinomonas sp. CT5 TaxID=2066133 RepID=UPI0018512552|nr:hypothetical protein [Marinomonas sp. CT5]NVK72168.1 hypothetical protein [Oceanospirillaceae bacterium]QUX97557.1 hypothetical protein C0J08_20075 [Marinomonas sp. CT5]